MGKRPKTDTAICRNFCTYYKPGKNEELACQGFVVVHGIISRGKRISQERPNRLAAADGRIIEMLKDRVCGVCEFHADGCDFILTSGGASPCGGFALLSHLFASGELEPEDLDTIKSKSKT